MRDQYLSKNEMEILGFSIQLKELEQLQFLFIINERNPPHPIPPTPIKPDLIKQPHQLVELWIN